MEQFVTTMLERAQETVSEWSPDEHNDLVDYAREVVRLSALAVTPSREQIDAAAERVAKEWDNHGKGRYFAEVYEAVAAELQKTATDK
jgi:hypothetical protein